MATAWILAAVTTLAAAVSASTGVAGGVILLAALVMCMPAAAVVPLHGAVQLVAGLSRAWMFRRHVDRDVLVRFAAGLVPGSVLGALGVWWLRELDPAWLRIALAGAILFSLLPRRSSDTSPSWSREPRIIAGFGLVCGTLSMLIGSVGPLISRGLLARGMVKEAHVGTKAAIQVLGHGLKIALFGLALDFDFQDHAPLIALLGAAVVVGTLAGKRILDHISGARFGTITKVLLAVLAVQLIARELWGVLGY